MDGPFPNGVRTSKRTTGAHLMYTIRQEMRPIGRAGIFLCPEANWTVDFRAETWWIVGA